MYRHCCSRRETEREDCHPLSSPFLLLTTIDALHETPWNGTVVELLWTQIKTTRTTGTRNDHDTAPCVGVHKLSKLDQHLTRPYGAEVVC